MKKLYLRFINPFVSQDTWCIKAVKIFFLAFILCCFNLSGFAQVVVTAAPGGSAVCAQSAVSGSAPACTPIGTMTILETNATDISIGTTGAPDQITLVPPAGWQFCVSSVITYSFTGSDITTVSTGLLSATSLHIDIVAGGTVTTDQIDISGLQVQPITPTSVPGNITASSVFGIAGIATGSAGTNFGSLTVVPMPITGPTQVCVGSTIQLLNATPSGGTWASSAPAIGSIDRFTGVFTGRTPGVTTDTFTAGSCYATTVVTVIGAPAPITGVHDTCAWVGRMTICNATPTTTTTPSYWSSTLVTVTAVGSCATLQAYAPGLATVTYSTTSGCFVTKTLMINPLPAPILGLRDVCVGSTTTLFDSTLGGSWSASSGIVSLGTAGLQGGNIPDSILVFGGSAGTVGITYRLPTGCKTDTQVIVHPIPAAITGGASVCVGFTTTLSNTVGGGIWTSGTPTVATIGSSSGIVTGVTAGTSIITYTIAFGCQVTYIVTVNPLPLGITGTAVWCQGDSVQLTSLSTGGTWSSSNPSVGSVGTTGWVMGVSGGTATITYTLPTGCATYFSITVNPLPSAITGPSAVCVGSTITLSSSPGGGSWSSNPSLIAFINPVTGVVTGVNPGSAIITYTMGTGCFVTTTITVNPLPFAVTAIPDFSLCAGSTTSLFSASPGGFWSSGTTSVALVGSDGVVTGITAGTSIITYTLPTGCSDTAIVRVYPMPGPITGPTSVCLGQTITLSNATTGGSWSAGSGSVLTIDPITGIITTVGAGTESITYSIVPPGCMAPVFSVRVDEFYVITGDTTVCVGDTIKLTDVAPGGIWSHSTVYTDIFDEPATSSTVENVAGLSPGVDVITFTFTTVSGTCVDTHTVTVLDKAPITGPREVCVGSSITLSDIVLGGNWTVDGSTSTVASIGLSSGILTGGPASGIARIYYSLSTGCLSMYEVTVNPLPNPFSGANICQGATITMSDGVPGGSWISSNVAVGTIGSSDGVLTGVGSGTTIITYQLPTGCLETATVVVYPLTPIIGTLVLCEGLTTTLTDLTPGGTWASSNTSVATIGSTGDVSAILAGTTIITYHLPTGCEAYATFTVNPLPAIITGTDSVCVLATVTLSDATPGGSWISSNTAIATIGTDGDATGISAGTVTITYLLPTGCLMTASLKVNPIPSPIIGNREVCLNFTTTLSSGTPLGVWSSVNMAVGTIGSATGIFGGLSVGTSEVSYLLPITGCGISTTVTVHAPPVISVFYPPITCRGSVAKVYATGANTAFGTIGRYTWSPATALSCTLCDTTYASPPVTTTYSVIGVDTFGCADSLVFELVIDSLLNHMAVTGQDSVCAGACTQFIASGRDLTYYNWKPPVGLSCTICDTVTACPDTTTLYTGVAIDRIGCMDSITFLVQVVPLPSLTVTPFPAIQCRGIPLNLYATGSFYYIWRPSYGLSCDSCANPVANDTINVVYNLLGISNFGCMDSLSVKVSVLDTNINTISNDTIICIGNSVPLSVTSHSTYSNLDVPSFYWTPSTYLDGEDITSTNVTSHEPQSTITYSVVVFENACFTRTLTVTIDVEPLPVITITPASQLVVAGTPVQLIATVTNVKVQHYLWTPSNGLSCDTCFNPIATPSVNTTYTIKVTSEFGCISEDTIGVRTFCDQSEVFIPNTFTPNGDGANDRFWVSAKGITMVTRLSVFNRWGQLVFDVRNIVPNDPGGGWDGTFKGFVLEPDVFVYEVEVICEKGEKFSYKGDVSIVH